MKYYYRHVNVRHGEYTFDLKRAVQLPADMKPQEWFEDHCKDFYGEADEHDYYQGGNLKGKYIGTWFHGGQIFVKPIEIKEVTKEEYEVLNKYI